MDCVEGVQRKPKDSVPGRKPLSLGTNLPCVSVPLQEICEAHSQKCLFSAVLYTEDINLLVPIDAALFCAAQSAVDVKTVPALRFQQFIQ